MTTLLLSSIAAASLLLNTAQAQRSQLPSPPSAAVNCPAADGPAEDITYPLRKLAFEALTGGDAATARRLMRCALRAKPTDLVALKQIVYLDLNAGDEAGAIEDIDALRAQHASEPRFESQEGYIFFGQKRYPEARAAFVRAAAGTDATVRADALRAIEVIDAEFPSHQLEVGVDAQYLNRFDDGVVDAYARYFQRLGKRSPLQAFVGARLLRDTASQVGPLPQIFSDNAFMSGLGLAFQPHEAHYFVSAEANIAYVLYGGYNSRPTLKSDYRTIVGYYNVFRPGRDSAFRRLSFQANGSFGFYSRYQHDAIAYLQPQETYDLNRGSLRVSPFFQQSFAFDTNRQFFNNTAELIPGVQFTLERVPGAALRTEYVRGYYLPVHSTSINPYGSTYNDFRIRLTFDKSFFLHGASQPTEPAAGAPH